MSGRVVAVALLLLMVPVTMVTAGTSSDDPGRGADAPDTYPDALALGTPGTYEGHLAPQGDSDWYKLSAVNVSALDLNACIQMRTWGDTALADASLTVEGSANTSVHDELNPDSVPEMGLATGSFSNAVFGFEPLTGNESTGGYNFSVDVLELDDLHGDAGTGLDAPSLENTTSPIHVDSPCFGGELVTNDTADAYTIGATEGQTLVISGVDAGDELVNVTLLDPYGNERLFFEASDLGTTHEVPVDLSGDWTLDVAGPSGTTSSYLFGWTLVSDDPEEDEEERECEPYCFMVD